jgi:hypothetical protein
MNGAQCKENVIGASRHAYCDCLPGYNGIKCENRMCLIIYFLDEIILFYTAYFKCTLPGKFIDSFMDEQGKYYECTLLNGCKLKKMIVCKYYLFVFCLYSVSIGEKVVCKRTSA